MRLVTARRDRDVVPQDQPPLRGDNSYRRHWLVNLIVLGVLLAACGLAYEFVTWQPPGKLSIVLENAPRGATVSVDGKRVENLARAVVLTPGEHEVIIRAFDGTVLQRRTVLLEPDEPKTIYVLLETPSIND